MHCLRSGLFSRLSRAFLVDRRMDVFSMGVHLGHYDDLSKSTGGNDRWHAGRSQIERDLDAIKMAMNGETIKI